jgi:hypothetical protein
MFEIRGVFSELHLDVGRFTKTLDATMEIQLRQAARAWLRAVIVKVPVWTGMSVGSFIPLGAFLRVKIPIVPSASPFAQAAIRQGRTAAAGAAASTFEFRKEGHKYIFEFDEGVPSYAINEYFNVKPPINLITPGPYGSFRAGEQAFQDYVTNEIPKRLPRIENIVVTKKRALY